MPNLKVLSCILLLLTAGAESAFAQAAPTTPPTIRARPGYDAATGRDLLNYPPHRTADLLHQRVELAIPDMNVQQATGSTTIRFTPIGADTRTLVLQAADLNIRSVVSAGRSATFAASPGDDRLEISFDPPVSDGEVAEVRIEYEILNPAEGMIWTPESPHWPGRPASLHTQGQTEFNRCWFPTHDFPNERLTSEMIVRVPPGYTACSNGRLVSRELTMMPAQPEKPAEKFHFLQEREHAPYLISLAVGKWDVVDVSTFGERLPMPVYVPLGQGKYAKPVFGRTPKMISLFERLFTEPYPWDKYAQVVVTNFAWGGMENTSATHLYDTVVFDEQAAIDGDEDTLICHELAHQWFGDLLTCRSWEHVWLNEGWATYAEALWAQYKNASIPSRPGADASPVAGLKADNDAYQYAIWSNLRSVIEADAAEAPFAPGMVSKEYAYPDAVFDRHADPYAKGAFVIHMLRQKLTDPVFWRGIALYVSRHKWSPVETYDLRSCMEEVSGLSLQRFFDQWCYRPSIPHLRVTPVWTSETRSLAITAEQTQPIDGPNPAYFFDLPVWIDDGSSKPRVVTLSAQTRTATLDVVLEREPRRVVIDPEMHVLAAIESVQPAAKFVDVLRNGPTLAARLEAVRQLGTNPGERGIDALATLVRDARAFQGLRIQAARMLGRMVSPAGSDSPPRPEALAALLTLTGNQITDTPTRKELVAAIGIAAASGSREEQARVSSWLLGRWEKDPSNAVRAEALRSLGRLKSVDAMAALAAGLSTPSHGDVIRIGAIEAIALAGFPDGLDQAISMTTPNRAPPVRQAAINAAATLASSDPERVFNILSALINDNEHRARQAAVEAMLRLEDPRARLTIEQWSDAARGRHERLWARDLLRRHAEDRAARTGVHSPTP